MLDADWGTGTLVAEWGTGTLDPDNDTVCIIGGAIECSAAVRDSCDPDRLPVPALEVMCVWLGLVVTGVISIIPVKSVGKGGTLPG